jgi:hypothetical protein
MGEDLDQSQIHFRLSQKGLHHEWFEQALQFLASLSQGLVLFHELEPAPSIFWIRFKQQGLKCLSLACVLLDDARRLDRRLTGEILQAEFVL